MIDATKTRAPDVNAELHSKLVCKAHGKKDKINKENKEVGPTKKRVIFTFKFLHGNIESCR